MERFKLETCTRRSEKKKERKKVCEKGNETSSQTEANHY